MNPRTCARAASALFAAEVLFAVVHRATGARYPGFTHTHDVVIDTALATIWSAAALAALLRRPWQGFFVMLAGVAATIIHGFMFSVATSGRAGPHGAGLPFLAGAILQAYWVVRAAPAFFAPESRPELPEREQEPARRHAWLPAGLRHSH